MSLSSAFLVRGEAKREKRPEAYYRSGPFEESLIAIASSLGFSSQSYFQRVFKEATGTTPLAYRKAKAGS